MKNANRTNRQRGVAIIEFTLILPLLLIMMFVVTELGRAVMQYNTLTKSVRDAVRYLSLQLPGTKIEEARNLVVYGKLTAVGEPLVAGLTTAHVPTPTWQPSGANPVITTVTIQVSGYTFQPLVGSAFGISFGPFAFSDIRATMRSHL